MKKKNVYRALLFAAALSLTGLKEQKTFAKENNPVTELDTEEDLARKEKETWKNFAEEMFQNESMYVDYSGGYTLCLYNRDEKKCLSEDFYTNLNTLLENNDITRLYFYNVDDRFDFSKVNLSNIKDLALSLYSYEKTLPQSIFDQTFSELYFYNTSLDVATLLMKQCASKDACVKWYENIEKKGSLEELLKFLTQEKIEMRSFDVNQINEQNYSGITKEELELLGKVQASSIDVTIDGVSHPLNINIELNEKIDFFSFSPYQNFYDGIKGELGNIKIVSSNENLTCWFSHVDITKNTHFSVPSSTSVRIYDLNVLDTTAINELQNVPDLLWGGDYLPGMGPDNIGYIEYKKDGDFDTDPLGHAIGQYTDFQEMLAYLDSYVQLLKVRKTLEVSPYEESRYQNTLSIGDLVNLNSDDALIYENKKDLQNQENGKTSYYGTSELRCVLSLCLTKGEESVDVYNMDDYEYYINEGYVVTGSNLVNQYSLNSDGELIPEGRYDNASLDLVHARIPFK